ncbi:MAG: SH3 domain-containing protein [Pseudomonadota bacterium]
MKNRSVAAFVLSSCCAAAFFSPPAAADLRQSTPSGLPVPRFVSMKYDETRCRIGPSRQHGVKYTFQRKGAPVMVIAETRDHWRKLRDRDGAECWAHASVLAAPTHAYARRQAVMRKKPTTDAAIRARIEDGALVRILKEQDGWVKIAAGAHRGWAAAGSFWGVQPSEK